MYISMLTKKELARLPREEALANLGVIEKGTILQPAKCRKCGSYTLIAKMEEEYLQCPECGHIALMQKFENTFFKGN